MFYCPPFISSTTISNLLCPPTLLLGFHNTLVDQCSLTNLWDLRLGELNGMIDYLAVSVVDLLYKRGKIGYSSWSSWLYEIKGNAGSMSRTESKNPKMDWENPFRAPVSISVGVWKGAQMWRSRLSVIKLWRKDDGGVCRGYIHNNLGTVPQGCWHG